MRRKIKLYEDFLIEKDLESLGEIVAWSEIDFTSSGEKSVADVTEENLLTKDLVVVYGGNIFKKLQQISSSEKPEVVLQVTDHKLTIFRSPFEFLKWEILGASETIEESFILARVNLKSL